VPEDVSIIGLDGLALGRYLVPQLSTVKQDFKTITLRRVAILLENIEEDAPARHETIPFQVLRSESIRSISR
jgi:LacI family transcriptional regulator